MVNSKRGNEMWKVNWSTWHKRGTKTNLVPDSNRTHDLPNTGRALYPLSYGNSWRARSPTWIHVWQASCILLGSALSSHRECGKWIKTVNFKLTFHRYLEESLLVNPLPCFQKLKKRHLHSRLGWQISQQSHDTHASPGTASRRQTKETQNPR